MVNKVQIIGVISVAALLVGFVSPAKAQTFPGVNGRIAYTQEGRAGKEVWTMRSDGRGKQKIANRAHSPAWSPDGRQLAFIKHGRLTMQLGTKSRQLTTERHAREETPVWSVDGSSIAFVRKKMHGTQKQSAIFTIQLNGSNEKNISGWGGHYRSPSWAPDGTRLVYEVFNDTSASLVVHTIQTNIANKLVELSDVTDSSQVSWSPTGKKILYRDSQNEIYTIWPDGSHRAVISDGDSYRASWSPDGKNILFLEDFSGEAVNVTEEDGTVVQIPLAMPGYTSINSAVWSPDKTKILFSLTDNQQKVHSFVLDRDSGSIHKLAHGKISEFSWQAKSLANVP